MEFSELYKKSVFKEKRFVLDKEAEQKVEGAEKEVPSKPEKGVEEAADVKKSGKKERIKIKSDMKLEQLKKQLEDKKFLAEFKYNINFEGFSTKGFKFNEDPGNYRTVFVQEITKDLDKKGKIFEDISKYFEADQDTVKGIIAEIFATAFIETIDKEKKFRQDYYNTLDAEKKGKVEYKVVGLGGTSVDEPFFKVKFSEEFEKGYEEKKVEKPAEKKQQEKKKQEELSLQNRAEELAKTPLGRILGMLTYSKKVDGRTGFDKIVSGEDFIGVFIVGLFGYGRLLPADAYEGLVGLLPDKYKEKVKAWENKARGTKIGTNEQTAKKPGESDEGGKSPEKMDLKLFSNALEAKGLENLPAQGAELSADYKLGVKGQPEFVKVMFGNGGEMIFPENSSFKINGSSVEVAKGKTESYPKKTNEIKIEGNIPKGTVFKGKMNFEVGPVK